MGSRGADGPRTLTTLEQAVKLIQILKNNGPMGVTEISDNLGISKGTAHAYVTTLREQELVSKDGPQYDLSLNLLKLGNHVRKHTKIFQFGKDEAYKLAAQSEGQVHLAVENDFEVVYVFRVLGKGPDDVGSTVGDTTDLHASGAGKALLAQFSDDKLDRYIAENGLTKYTNNTIAEPEDLYEEMEKIRQQGYAVANEEQVLGAGTVAAPVVLHDGELIGAITVSVPATRLREEHQKIRLGDMVNESSDRITMGAGFNR